MLTRWQGGFAAMVVTALTFVLVILDLADVGFRLWWTNHALTTDTVAGMLVLLITVLVADQVVSRRQVKERSAAVAAQAAIVMGQATRTSKAVSSALDGSGDQGVATDEIRTYMIMLLVGAPVLIDATVSRHFLEEAQRLGGQMASAMAALARTPGVAIPRDRLDEAVQRLRAASTPLLQLLSPETRIAARGDESE
jgi:hypothetical protein